MKGYVVSLALVGSLMIPSVSFSQSSEPSKQNKVLSMSAGDYFATSGKRRTDYTVKGLHISTEQKKGGICARLMDDERKNMKSEVVTDYRLFVDSSLRGYCYGTALTLKEKK